MKIYVYFCEKCWTIRAGVPTPSDQIIATFEKPPEVVDLLCAVCRVVLPHHRVD
jgi:hypothetical protein